MQTKVKMNTLLAQVEHSAQCFKQNVSQYINLFKKNQGMFQGLQKTYTPRDGQPDDPTKQGTTRVAATVTEEFDWMKSKTLRPYLEQLFAVESTNSKGANTVELKVGNVSFGNLTALELMRMKSILTDANFLEMLRTIPVRSDASIWKRSTNEEYTSREVYESPLQTGVVKTTVNEDIVLKDPNLDPQHLPANYQSKITQKRTLVELGDYTMQTFSGEWTQHQKAQLLDRISKLTEAVIAALKDVNDCESEDSNLNVDTFIDYVFKA
jgi:hypothetical protein